MPTLDPNTLAILSAVGSLGQVVTAFVAVLVALVTFSAARAFNRGQALKFRVEHINEFNAQIVALAQSNREAAEIVGMKVTPSSDILQDYLNFMRINAAHLEWMFALNGVIGRKEADAALLNTAEFLRRFGQPYVEAILRRGYDPNFAIKLTQLIRELGGYSMAETQNPPHNASSG